MEIVLPKSSNPEQQPDPDRHPLGRGARIALLLPSMAGGGVERVILQLAGGFLARGLIVDLLLCRPVGPMLAQVPEGVRVIKLRASSAGLGRLLALTADPSGIGVLLRPCLLSHSPPRSLAYLADLARYLRHERPNSLISPFPHENVVAVLANRLAGSRARIAVCEHNVTSRLQRDSRKWKRRYLAPLIQRTYSMADAVIAVSDDVRNALAGLSGLPPKSIVTIHNPVVGPDLAEQARAPCDHPWLAPGELPVILGAGRLVEQKDFATLIRAFARLRRRRRARLMILGTGKNDIATESARTALLRLAASYGVSADIALPGFKSNPFAFMARAAVFVLSSRYEGFGNVLVEALACGCPVVSTDCPGGPREILEGGRFGELVPVGDESAMAEAILRALGRPPDPERLIARGQVFSVAAAADAYVRALSEAVPGVAARRAMVWP
jgi:glycosyltransferase involved in cell wall biosynthesis